jgi:hypothetical protein
MGRAVRTLENENDFEILTSMSKQKLDNDFHSSITFFIILDLKEFNGKNIEP